MLRAALLISAAQLSGSSSSSGRPHDDLTLTPLEVDLPALKICAETDTIILQFEYSPSACSSPFGDGGGSQRSWLTAALWATGGEDGSPHPRQLKNDDDAATLWPGQPWGFYTNYQDPTHPNITDDMLTDAMSTPAGRARIEVQLVGMQARNGTLWRIFPQFQDVLAGPETVNKPGIAALTAALDMAHAHGIQATVTGLSDFVPAHNPGWLNKIGEDIDSEARIQAVSELWWGTLAKAWKGHPAVFSFDLQNEPVWMNGPLSGGMSAPGANPWITGCMGTTGTHQKCFDFKHNRHYQHTWDAWVHANFADEAAIRAAWADYPMRANDTYAHPALPTPHKMGAKPLPKDAARQANYTQHMQQMMIGWASGLSKAIKAEDSSRLISVGELSLATGQERLYADQLDYYSVHMYPHPTSNTTALLRTQFQNQMDELPDDGKPVFVEEFFPLSLSLRRDTLAESYADYMSVFLEVTQPRTRAYTTYYCANNPSAANPIVDAICDTWLLLLQCSADAGDWQECATNGTTNDYGKLSRKSDDTDAKDAPSRGANSAGLPAGLRTFGIGRSAFRIQARETEIYQYNLSSTGTVGVMTHFWLTGSPARSRTAAASAPAPPTASSATVGASRACNVSSFPFEFSGIQCMNFALLPNASTVEQCAAACCAQTVANPASPCKTWELWNKGCWYGGRPCVGPPTALGSSVGRSMLNDVGATPPPAPPPAPPGHWATGADNVTVRYYVDGEATASIQFKPPMAAGVGFGDDSI